MIQKLRLKLFTKSFIISVAAFFAVVAIASAVTTISANIATGGTLSVTGASTLTGDVTAAGDLALNGGDLTTTSATFNLANAATTFNIGSTNIARTINLGTGTEIDTLNIGTGATGVDVIRIGQAAADLALTDANWSITTAGLITTADDLALNGGDLTTTSATFNLANAATTFNIGSTNIARTINLGTGTEIDTLNIGTGATGVDVIRIGQAAADLALTDANWSIATTGAVTGLSGITSAMITDATIATADIAAAAVTEAKLAASSDFGLGTLRTARAKYDFAVDGGVVSTITPATNATIPDNAVIVGATINSTTAATSGGAATIAVGTSAGSSTTSLLGATAVASFSADALINSVATHAASVKMTAAGSITLTVATAALTAGVIEVTVIYFVAAN